MSSISEKKEIQTNVQELTFGPRGIDLPEESTILNWVIEDFKNAFGKDLKFTNERQELLLSTPQGQLATAWAAIISDRNRLLAYYVNQVDPNYAMGRMQDGIGRIYFIERRKASATRVVGKCSGAVNTVIPVGTKVKDQLGNLYESIGEDAVIIDQDVPVFDEHNNYVLDEHNNPVTSKESCVYITFKCVEDGAISCPARKLTERYQVIPGWESITNEQDGEVGSNTESQAQFEQRRRLSVAVNSVNSVDSIMAELLNSVYEEQDQNGNIRKNIPICQDAYVTENSESISKTIGSVVLEPHSIYVCVAASGGYENEQAIAKAIWRKKPPGCGMNLTYPQKPNSHTVTIFDDSKDDLGNSLYSNPPQYDITYFYATTVPIQIYISMTRSPSAPKDARDQVKDAVFKAFQGGDGSARPRIGSVIYASNFYSPIQKLGNWAVIRTLLIGRDGGSGNEVKVGINEIPSLDKSYITVNFDD
ncbi:Uncharacterized phage protein gp47/JayE (JayE) [Commensalibacter communis]|uniref:baseplate J/gp47 family protein n=1 Tax=Commensalibacter communis TaxID=2972786 RepID=UPI0022FF8E52|nr:baseplate J/gp47 family protein [Commensalibacter communis]CAI3955006.1 Uncharacterized phage protein gp47/JayE (JayE) [Commensalibacter communis]CAI3955751.1 Uncharacterized phage protein gp47/JayE (JayE) [Commensalibacter communis]